jgi:hypothetical protein
MRLSVLKERKGVAKFLDYQRSRLRAARATVLDATLGAPLAFASLLLRDAGALGGLSPRPGADRRARRRAT